MRGSQVSYRGGGGLESVALAKSSLRGDRQGFDLCVLVIASSFCSLIFLDVFSFGVHPCVRLCLGDPQVY